MSTQQDDGQKPNSENPTQPEVADADMPINPNPPEMSTEEMDAFLKENDPEFMKSVEKMSSDKTLTMEQEEVDEDQAALRAEIEQWKTYKGFWKYVYKVFPFAPFLSFKSKNVRFKFKSVFYKVFIHVKNFIFYLFKEALPKTLAKLKAFNHRISESFSKASHAFKYLKWQIKILFFISVGLIAVAGFVVFKSIRKDFIKEEKPLFIAGLGELSSHAYDYDPKDVEPYINNARAAQNVILTRKIFVNLKPSAGSGANPMAAFEFFIEGMTSDVVIEIKDREPKIQDLIQRTIEEMTFEELDTEQGKKELCRRLQEEVTKVLTTGSVKVVRIKTVILKP